MAVENSRIINFDMVWDGECQEVPSLSTISDNQLIELILNQIPPKRRSLARNQIKIYFKKIISHPEIRLEYIQKIKQLVIYEKNFNKNRVDLNYD